MNVLFLCFGFSACGKREIIGDDSSQKFSDAEITSAENAVIKKIEDFKGCDLVNLYYDEEKSNNAVEDYMSNGSKGSVNGVENNNIIVLFSDFKVDSKGGDGSFNPNSTYTDWMWILIRDSETSEWEVDDWGY